MACYETIVDLFFHEAMVKLSFYRFIPASLFYKDLLNDTSVSTIKLKNIFLGSSDKNRAAAYFEYLWTLKDSKQVRFEVIDLFDFDQNDKIAQIAIIYDTYLIRPALLMGT